MKVVLVISCSGSAMLCDTSATAEDLYMDVQPIHSEQVRKSLADIQLEGTAMVAALRANSNIPYSVIPNISNLPT